MLRKRDAHADARQRAGVCGNDARVSVAIEEADGRLSVGA